MSATAAAAAIARQTSTRSIAAEDSAAPDIGGPAPSELLAAAASVAAPAVDDVNGIVVFTGQNGRNRFGVSGWEQTLNQQFQFGDLRVETPAKTLRLVCAWSRAERS